MTTYANARCAVRLLRSARALTADARAERRAGHDAAAEYLRELAAAHTAAALWLVDRVTDDGLAAAGLTPDGVGELLAAE
jgi:hypothetical protein